MPTFYEPGDFTGKLFQECGFLVDCHLYDTSEPWYEDISETAYRAWERGFPVPANVPGLAAAVCATKNKQHFVPGFITQSRLKDSRHPVLGFHPCFFSGGRHWSFWHGNVWQFGPEWMAKARDALQSACNEDVSNIFPMRISAAPHILEESCCFQLDGFGYFADRDNRVALCL